MEITGVELFMLVNMALDLLLLLGLAFWMTRQRPVLYGLLLAANILPYFIHLPLEEIPGVKTRGPDTSPGYHELMDVVRHPDNIVGKKNIPFPALRLPELFSAFKPPSEVVDANAPAAAPVQPEAVALDGNVFAGWHQALRSDPQALWLFLRLFWTAGALVVFFQDRRWGMTTLGLQLIPFPFLTYALPYAALFSISMPDYAALGATFQDSSEIWDYLLPKFYTTLTFGGMIVLVAGALYFMATASRKLSPKQLLLKTYLVPDRYLVKLNGNILPFEVRDHLLIIEGIPFDCSDPAVNADKPNIWLLGSRTQVEFIDRKAL
ncbi:MAG: hypothetical protein SFU85_13490 [Candidatus Methylacidiphilales bacterium]|nr:hypothetical protein [Candidatus Methylacidiphilales bacterium]